MDEPSQINLGPRAVTASLLLILERFVGSKSQGWAVSLLRENTHLQLFRMTFTTSRCSYDDVLGFRHVNYCSSYQTLYLHIHILNIAPRKKKTQGHENDTWTVSFPWSPRLRCEGCGPTPSNSQYRNDQPGVAWLVPGRFLVRSAWQLEETNLVIDG